MHRLFDQDTARAEVVACAVNTSVANTITVTWRLSGRVKVCLLHILIYYFTTHTVYCTYCVLHILCTAHSDLLLYYTYCVLHILCTAHSDLLLYYTYCILHILIYCTCSPRPPYTRRWVLVSLLHILLVSLLHIC